MKHKKYYPLLRLLKILALSALAIYGVHGFFNPKAFSFINGVNILFHEAGHMFFMPLGEYLHVWGGTLTQCLIPLGLSIAFYFKREKFGASIMLFWFGQNFIPISTYLSDARAQSLPLLGGNIHDWAYILGKANLLEYDQVIGQGVALAGLILMLTAATFGVFSALADN